MIKKTKWIVGGIASFAVMASVTTALATWVVVTDGSSAPVSGQAIVGKVEDASVKIDLTTKKIEGISFEPDVNDNKGRVQSSGVAPKLDFNIKGSVTFGSETAFNNFGSLKLAFTSEALADAKSHNFITFPEDITKTPEKLGWTLFTSGTGEKEKTFTFDETMTFGWGALFNGTNPSLFFDGEVAFGADPTTLGENVSCEKKTLGGDVSTDDIKTILNKMYTELNSKSFTVTVSQQKSA